MQKLLLSLCLFAAPALADEGMWTFDNFPEGGGETEVRRRCHRRMAAHIAALDHAS